MRLNGCSGQNHFSVREQGGQTIFTITFPNIENESCSTLFDYVAKATAKQAEEFRRSEEVRASGGGWYMGTDPKQSTPG